MRNKVITQDNWNQIVKNFTENIFFSNDNKAITTNPTVEKKKRITITNALTKLLDFPSDVDNFCNYVSAFGRESSPQRSKNVHLSRLKELVQTVEDVTLLSVLENCTFPPAYINLDSPQERQEYMDSIIMRKRLDGSELRNKIEYFSEHLWCSNSTIEGDLTALRAGTSDSERISTFHSSTIRLNITEIITILESLWTTHIKNPVGWKSKKDSKEKLIIKKLWLDYSKNDYVKERILLHLNPQELKDYLLNLKSRKHKRMVEKDELSQLKLQLQESSEEKGWYYCTNQDVHIIYGNFMKIGVLQKRMKIVLFDGESYMGMPKNLGPESFHFTNDNGKDKDIIIKIKDIQHLSLYLG